MNANNSKPIGVFDSGVGGLTVVRALMERLPNENIVYFGDTARVPYGVKSRNTIEDFSLQIVDFLLQNQVKALVIACNTISEGGLTETSVDVRLILQGALLTNATQIILAHNHPSGNLKPSSQDDMLTRNVKNACEVMRVHFADHLILSADDYYSYRDEGRI